MKLSSSALRIAAIPLCLLVGMCLTSCLFTSCKKASPIAREKHWFDLAFDSTHHATLQAEENENLAEETNRLGVQIASGLKEEARNQSELERLGRAAQAGIQTILTEYNESGTQQCFELFVEQRRLCAQYPSMFSWEGGEKLLKEANTKRETFIQNLRDHKEEIREKGWRQYLVDRKFSQ